MSTDGTAERRETDELVLQYFCRDGAPYGPYRVPGGGAVPVGEELVKDVLYRYELVDASRRTVILQLYRDVDLLGGRLWEREVRVLLQVAGQHPALPEMLSGTYDEHGKFAYVATRGGGAWLSDEPKVFANEPVPEVEMVRQLELLAGALATLGNLGVIHRNLWPGTVEVDRSGRLCLRLARFEMSAMLANLLRQATVDSVEGTRARHLLRSQGAGAFRYFPLERLQFLFPTDPTRLVEEDRSDVFSLGAMAWEWFLGPLPDPKGGLEDRQYGDGDGRLVLERIGSVHAAMRARLRSDRTLPDSLRGLLAWMLDPDPRSRPAAADVANAVRRRYEAWTGHWTAPPETSRPYLVTFVPRECGNVLRGWGWVRHEADDPEGWQELIEVIEDDLRAPELVFSEDGAEPFVPGGEADSKRQAQHVLLGQNAAWFCRRHRPERKGGALGDPLDDVMIILYIARRQDGFAARGLATLARGALRRRVSSVNAIPFNVHPAELEAERQGRPLWTPILDATRPVAGLAGDDLRYQEAFDWLIEYQWLELHAREYPFVRESAEEALVATLRLDEDADRRYRQQSVLRRKFMRSPRRRPGFVDFFKDLDDEGGGKIEVLGGPNPFEVDFKEECGADAILVRRHRDSPPIPDRGRLRPADDRGSEIALRRQQLARREFLDKKVLLRQLQEPSTISGLAGRWPGAGRSLKGEAPRIVADMLGSRPFFALQGPPGTGKTEVASHAIDAYLERERGARVLVTAQSNYALDNLAERLLRQLGVIDDAGAPGQSRDTIPLRVVSRSALDRVHPVLRAFQLPQLTTRTRARILRQTGDRLAGAAEDGTVKILEHWLRVVQDGGPELADRLRRAANVVFATCSAATGDMVARSATSPTFDWVVIEEAARAWPTELAIPLVRGNAWALIGDHRQLPAHRKQEVLAFLDECAADPDPEVRAYGERRDQHLEVFDLFGRLFEDRSAPRRGFERPVRRLRTQFRMREPICEVVSRAFYPVNEQDGWRPAAGMPPKGMLLTGRPERPHPITSPHPLAGVALIWLDTEGDPHCADQPAWENPGEADLVARLVAGLKPHPLSASGRFGPHPLAVLTPYQRQSRLLRDRLDRDTVVATVPAYQGRDADVVVVSLVRDRPRGAPDRPWERIGYLTQSELINVMLSRARDLLIVVGRFAHFRDCGVDHWERVCACFGPGRPGTRLLATDVLPR